MYLQVLLRLVVRVFLLDCGLAKYANLPPLEFSFSSITPVTQSENYETICKQLSISVRIYIYVQHMYLLVRMYIIYICVVCLCAAAATAAYVSEMYEWVGDGLDVVRVSHQRAAAVARVVVGQVAPGVGGRRQQAARYIRHQKGGSRQQEIVDSKT